MKRLALIAALILVLPAMSKTPTSGSLPAACDILQTVDIVASLGSGTTYMPGILMENESVRMSQCSADTPDLSARMTLMVRETLGANGPDAATLRDQMIAELRDTIGAAVLIEDVQIGDAAIWVGEIGQLTVWHRAGRVMFIFSPTPMADRTLAEATAQKVLAAYP